MAVHCDPQLYETHDGYNKDMTTLCGIHLPATLLIMLQNCQATMMASLAQVESEVPIARVERQGLRREKGCYCSF